MLIHKVIIINVNNKWITFSFIFKVNALFSPASIIRDDYIAQRTFMANHYQV